MQVPFQGRRTGGRSPKDDPKTASEGRQEEKAGKRRSGAAAAKKKKSKKLVAMVVGVLAIGILAVVGISVMGGDDKNKSKGGRGAVAAPPGRGVKPRPGETLTGRKKT